MSGDMHVIELIPAYALECLDEEETVRVAEHLANCPACRAELLTYKNVVEELVLAAPDTVPPHQLKGQIMERVQRSIAPQHLEPRTAWWQRIMGLFQHAAPAWGLISLLLIVVLATATIWLWQRTATPRRTVEIGTMQVVAMAGTDGAPNGTGTLIISGDGEYGTLVVDGLPPLDDSHQYQLWLIHGEQRTSGGVFSVNGEGYGYLSVASPDPLSAYPAFGVTIEPAGGSPGPTGDKVLGGER